MFEILYESSDSRLGLSFALVARLKMPGAVQ